LRLVYLRRAAGWCTGYCCDVDCCGEIESTCEICEYFFVASQDTCRAGEGWYVYERRKEEGCGFAKCEIENADGAYVGSHSGNSNGAGGVRFV
jgi:hypothetical protein